MYYLNSNSFSHAVVTHVGDGFVTARPADVRTYGNCSGYIVTDDEYVEGDELKNGFYTYIGTKTVPLANGSSRTMHAFVKLDEVVNKKALDALAYNTKAVEAAKAELARRARAEQRAFDNNPTAQIDKLFRKALAGYDHTRQWKKIMGHIHVSNVLKGKIEIVDTTKWTWYTERGKEELDFDEFKRRLEDVGGAKYIEMRNKQINGTLYLSDVESCIQNLFDRDVYNLVIKITDATCKIKCCSITDRLFWNGDVSNISGINPKIKEQLYIVDIEKDDDIIGEAEISSDWDNGAAAFVKAFERKYRGK